MTNLCEAVLILLYNVVCNHHYSALVQVESIKQTPDAILLHHRLYPPGDIVGSIFLTNVRREDRAWSLETAGIEVRIFCQGSLNRVRAKLAYDI